MDAAIGVFLGTCASGCETYPLTPTVRRCICRSGLPGASGRREFPSGTDTIIYFIVKKEKDKMLRVMTNCPPT